MIEANEALSAGELGGGLGELISEEAKRQCARGLFEKKWQTLVYSTATILQCADARSSFGPMIEVITFVAQNKLAALFFDDLPESQYINPLEPETDEDRDRLFQQTIADLVSLAKEKEQIRSLTEDETKEIETERSGWEIKYLEKRLTGGDSFYRFSNTGGRLVFGVRTSESDISAIDISGLFETNPGELTEILGSHMVATYNKKHLWETINRELALHDDELVGMIPDVIKRLLEMEQAECTRVVDRLIQLDCVLRQAGLGSTSIGIPSDQWNRASPEARLAYNRDFRNMLLHMGSCTGVQKDKRN